jgi:hypothetical protein
MGGQAGSKHALAEFTRDDVTEMIARGPANRAKDTKDTKDTTPGAATPAGS